MMIRKFFTTDRITRGAMPALALFFPVAIALMVAGCSKSSGGATASSGFSDCGVDIHQHLNTAPNPAAYLDYARTLVGLMDQVGIRKSIIMPPPSSSDSSAGAHYAYTDIIPAANSQPGRLAISGGGGILNSMIHASHLAGGAPTAVQLSAFEQAAQAIADNGVAGFGEMAVLHLSYRPSHPFIYIPADHPMYLRLADVAARNNLPVDIHLELMSAAGPTPDYFRSASPSNPATLEENQSGFERLLSHNRAAKIVWVHVGWDNTGYMTAQKARDMVSRHSNLYLALKMLDSPGPIQFNENRPLDNSGALRSEWASLIADYPDRFLLGADEFVGSQSENAAGSPSTSGTWSILSRLPSDTARKLACENPAKIYRLN